VSSVNLQLVFVVATRHTNPRIDQVGGILLDFFTLLASGLCNTRCEPMCSKIGIARIVVIRHPLLNVFTRIFDSHKVSVLADRARFALEVLRQIAGSTHHVLAL
jgi:hypothetical protein